MANSIAEKQPELVDVYKKSLEEALSGWKRSLDSWKESIYIDFILAIMLYVAGILLGLVIGGAWR